MASMGMVNRMLAPSRRCRRLNLVSTQQHTNNSCIRIPQQSSSLLLLRTYSPTTTTTAAAHKPLWSHRDDRHLRVATLPDSGLSSAWCALRENMIGKPEPGRGFDNFTKGNDDSSKQKSDNNESKNSSGGGGDNNNNNNNPFQGWIPFALALGVAYVMLNNNNDHDSHDNLDGSPNGADGLQQREIVWHDFLRLLQQRDVTKIVVTDSEQANTATARVYLKPNATGLARYNNHRGSTANTDLDHDDHGNHNKRDDFYQQSQQVEQVQGLQLSGHLSGSDHEKSSSTPRLFYRLPIGSLDSFERKLDDSQRALNYSRHEDVPVQYTADSTWAREVMGIVPGVLMAAAMYGLMRYAGGGMGMGGGAGGGRGGGGGGMGGIFSVGKSTAKKVAKEDVNVDFSHVAGCDEAKREITEFVDFLKDSERFTKLGAKIPKGALLCGPPGTGKTLLAKAVAGEAGVPFYTISGSDFIEMFVGVGPSRVRDLFSEARQSAPCIVFIDEIDAVGRQRGRGGNGGNDERENTLNQLLVEMDGFSPSTGVVVLAGTNRVDILDQALTRPGRFDRQITVDKPDIKGRKDIFKVHLKGITLEGSVDDVAGRLAGLTPGFAGADIANICNEAAIVAARRSGESVTMADFEKATDRIIGGLESNKIMSKEERSIVAHHEAGHAVAGWFLEHADALLKVTIIPRNSGALGFAQYLPKEVNLRTQDQIMDIVCMALAGRAAEEVFFGRVTTGASDDLKRVTQLVYSTIQLYGMNNRLGQLAFPKDPNAMYEDRPYSEKTAKAMDEEAKTIVDEAYQRTLDLLLEKKEQVSKVADLLLEKETITHDDIIDIIGKRPFEGDPAYEEFIKRSRDSTGQEGDKDTLTPPTGDLSPGLV